MKRRDVGIQVLRAVATVFVIYIHTLMTYRNIDGEYQNTIIFFEAFTRCAVPIFFMITGFLSFPMTQNVQYYLRKYFKRILFPALITVAISDFFAPFVHAQSTFIENLINGRIDFTTMAEGLFRLNADLWVSGNIGTDCFHLWYIFVLLKVYLFFPVIGLICRDNAEATSVRRIVLTLTLLFNSGIPFIQSICKSFSGLLNIGWPIGMDIFCVIMGYEVKLYVTNYFDNPEKKEKRKKVIIKTFSLYVLFSVLIYLLSMNLDIRPDHVFNENFWGWGHLFPVLSGVYLFIFIYLIVKQRKWYIVEDGIINRVISTLDKESWNCYLIHYLIINLTRYHGVAAFFWANFSCQGIILLGAVNYSITVLILILIRKFKSYVVYQFKMIW